MLELLYTSPRKTFDTWDKTKNIFRWVFYSIWDAIILSGSYGIQNALGQTGTFKVFKDGHARCFMNGGATDTFPMLEMAGGDLCTFVKSGSSPNYIHTLYKLDSFAALPVMDVLCFYNTGTLLMEGGAWFVDYERELVFRAYNKYLYVYSFATGTLVESWRLYTGTNDFYDIHWVSDGKIMLTETRAADVLYPKATRNLLTFVDYLLQEIYLTTKINQYRLAVFDSRCGVVVSINDNGYTEVYYPQAVPSHLTAPVLDPAAVNLYGGSMVTTQVLGDMNEPCPDRVVHWYLEAGITALARTTSKTGSDGTASNYLFGPDNPAQVGLEETIRVEALI